MKNWKKRGAIVVRDDGETQLATIDGAAALDDAAWLAVPLPIEVRVLAARKHGAISTAE